MEETIPSFRFAQRDVAPSKQAGELRIARASFTVLSMLCMFWLAFLLGSRLKYLLPKRLRAVTLIRSLVFIIHILAVGLVFAAAVLLSGLGITSYSDCFSVIIVCLVFYMGGKIVFYNFLVERAHILRAPFKRRIQNKAWILGMLLVWLGLGALAVLCFIFPVAKIGDDGRCRLGMPFKIAIALLVYDIFINFALTAYFVFLLRPLLRVQHTSIAQERETGFRSAFRAFFQILWPTDDHAKHRLTKFLWKTIVGSISVMVPTAANIVLFTVMKGQEQGWMCLTICSLDVTWSVTILHWLTSSSSEMEGTTTTLQAGLPTHNKSYRTSNSLRLDTIGAVDSAASMLTAQPASPREQNSSVMNTAPTGILDDLDTPSSKALGDETNQSYVPESNQLLQPQPNR